MTKSTWYERLAFWCCVRGQVRVIEDHLLAGVAYLVRFYPLGRDSAWWKPFNLYLHRILRSDEGGLHDHPWWYVTVILAGGYWEHTPAGRTWRGPGTVLVRRAGSLHKLEVEPGKKCWTLFFRGKVSRVWGFINEIGNWESHETYIPRYRNAHAH